MVSSAKGAKMPRTSPYSIVLSGEERRYLKAAARRYTSPYREVVRARIVMYAAEGLGNDEIAARLGTPRQVVSKWRKRFCAQRLAGLGGLPRGGRPPALPPGRAGRTRGPCLSPARDARRAAAPLSLPRPAPR